VKVKVEMLAYGASGEIREVEIPQVSHVGSVVKTLGTVFYWGQNDFQPQAHCSVSCGDVILFEGQKFLVCNFGFHLLTEDEYKDYVATPRRDRPFKDIVSKPNVT
jgi:hypothetical protein